MEGGDVVSRVLGDEAGGEVDGEAEARVAAHSRDNPHRRRAAGARHDDDVRGGGAAARAQQCEHRVPEHCEVVQRQRPGFRTPRRGGCR